MSRRRRDRETDMTTEKKPVDKTTAAYRKYRRKKILFIAEAVLLVFVLLGVGVYTLVQQKLNSIQMVEAEEPVVEDEGNPSEIKSEHGKVVVNKAAETDEEMKGYTNVALFGVDSREGDLKQSNTDTIMIASINNDTKEVKLVSVYRDTYLNVGDDKYRKANSAYAYGGWKQGISMLNSNLDLNIDKFVTVDFDVMVDVIDLLGGLTVEMTALEILHMNNYCVGTSEVTGGSYTPLPQVDGVYELNGIQAVSYARVRYTSGNDYKRTARQREIVAKVIDKAKKADLITLNNIMDEVFPSIYTNFTKTEIITMAMDLLSYELGETTGFPYRHRTWTEAYYEVPVTLEADVDELHHFLFEDEAYEPSETVKEYSNEIISRTGFSDASQASDENYSYDGKDLAEDSGIHGTNDDDEDEE